ncbi:hypothetical protein [Chitinophaga sp. CF418]|uniref:hypothetical protein n=1 Tax=Chitinophaga sp. CF418 TaxID=1855287 RepID=UPI000912CC90|nr:hypothetical protein [Chitinophaga sp. CF418]SHN34423.1 hypothetical protein SAMN05216311_109288 [Chitinophaga sp. CF418]
MMSVSLRTIFAPFILTKKQLKLVSKYLFVLSLTSPNVLLGQSIATDSTKLSFIPYCYGGKDKLEDSIHLDWVQIDKDIIKEKLNKLPAVSSSLTEIKKVIPHFLDGKCNCRSINEDLGYGLKSTQHTIHGGYGSCNVDVIYWGNSVLKLRLTIDNHKEIIEKYLLKVIQLPFECVDGQIRYEKVYSENVQEYLKESGQLFLESADTNYRRRQAINYFMDVMTGGTFGKPFYIMFGLGSETFNNLRFFIVNKDYNALESILFSPSPTSRLFAARTLTYMQDKYGYKPTSDTYRRMKDVLANAQLIRSGIISCWINKFDYDYYDVVGDFEHLLMTQ